MDYILRGFYEKQQQQYIERCAREARKRQVMEDNMLQCGECGFLSDTVDKAEEHAKDFRHTNFILSNELFIDQHCCSCPTHCNSPMALELHEKKTGHTEYEDSEAKRKRKEAEEARRVEEYLAKIQAAIKEREEEIKIASEKKVRSQTRLSNKQQKMRSCLDSIKQSLKFDEQKQRALNTLVTIVKNVAEQPDEEKFRKIRISKIEKRLGYVEDGFKFLELCKFEKVEREEFFFLPCYEVEEELLKAANDELNRALSVTEE